MSQRKQRESGLQARVETGSEHLHATHGREAETEHGFPGWFLGLPDCHALCPRKLCDFLYGSQISVVEGPLFNSLPSSSSPRWVPFLLQSSLMSPRDGAGSCEATGQAGIFLGPQSLLLRLSLGEQFWMKDSFNNFISDPFLPMKLLF